MTYRVEITRKAQKQIAALPSTVHDRVERKIAELSHEPRPPGSRQLRAYGEDFPHWRIRIGDYRVVYAIDDAVRIVTVQRVAHRGKVYRD